MDLGLKDKVAVVAAASQGLGKACALAFAREGAKVVLFSRRKNEIDAAALEIANQTGAEVVGIVADVLNSADIKRVVAEAKARFGAIHILVNNAGGPPTGNLLTLSDDDWRRGHELTLMSTVRLTREALPFMIEQQWGRIITISSFVAKEPINELILSAVIRPGLHALAKILANQHARNNITVNAVCPGYVLTKRQEELGAARSKEQKVSMEEYLSEQSKNIPAGRFGTPEEIGNVVAFLASERASYINGANILVDGGLTKAFF
jgi:3-oxoacyl-[acyl-carrier protein] reductase